MYGLNRIWAARNLVALTYMAGLQWFEFQIDINVYDIMPFNNVYQPISM